MCGTGCVGSCADSTELCFGDSKITSPESPYICETGPTPAPPATNIWLIVGIIVVVVIIILVIIIIIYNRNKSSKSEQIDDERYRYTPGDILDIYPMIEET
jgi:hypothetical protein